MKGHLVRRGILAVGLATAVVFSTAAPSGAAWFWSQGTNAEVQNINLTNYSPDYTLHIGWGLDLYQAPSSNNWVHIPIPGPGSSRKRVRFVKLNMALADQMSVTAVHAYNGGQRVSELTTSIVGGSIQVQTIDLGSRVPVDRGLSLALQIEAGPSASDADRRFILYGAGANFVTPR